MRVLRDHGRAFQAYDVAVTKKADAANARAVQRVEASPARRRRSAPGGTVSSGRRRNRLLIGSATMIDSRPAGRRRGSALPRDEAGRERDTDEDQREAAHLGQGQWLTENRGPVEEREPGE